MSDDTRAKVADTMRRLAAGPQPTDRLAIGRVQIAGEPHGWHESIAFERNGWQRYMRTRSFADAGGAPIGQWQAPADDQYTAQLAAALCTVQAWNADPGPVEFVPGMEVVNWTIITRDAVLDLIVPSGSPLLPRFMPVDLLLRRIANSLEEQASGSMLRVAMQHRQMGDQVALRIALINDGNQRVIVVNPFVAAVGDSDFFRLELATLKLDAPGESGYGAVFYPLPDQLLPPPARTGPWADDYLVIDAANRLLLPHTLTITLPAPGRFMLRAVLSRHGALDQIAGIPVARGRAFSNEVVVEK